jgi:hypothetical protein
MAAFSLSEISELALLISAGFAAAFQVSSYTRSERSSFVSGLGFNGLVGF